MLESKVAANAGDETACHVGGFEAECATACHRVDKRDGDCVFLSPSTLLRINSVRGTKSKDLDRFKNHAGGNRFLERGVVDESFVAASIELFSGEV